MAVLTAAQRKAIRALWGSLLSSRRQVFPLSKPDLDAAINATDDWQEANAAAYNAALPLPARTVLTAAEKNELFLLVAQKRSGG